jgi:hypothetical protein
MVMPVDDGLRSIHGVVACLTPVVDGKTRLVFDDARADQDRNPTSWAPTAVFTWKELDFAELKELKLSKRELAQVGENLLIRLLALQGAIA